jgi:hypothetical protein
MDGGYSIFVFEKYYFLYLSLELHTWNVFMMSQFSTLSWFLSFIWNATNSLRHPCIIWDNSAQSKIRTCNWDTYSLRHKCTVRVTPTCSLRHLDEHMVIYSQNVMCKLWDQHIHYVPKARTSYWFHILKIMSSNVKYLCKSWNSYYF